MSPRSTELFVHLDDDEAARIGQAARALGCSLEEVAVTRRSLDARRGHEVGFRLEVAVLDRSRGPAPLPEEVLPPPVRPGRPLHVVVVGSGPAGAFAALRLSEVGVRVTLLERGKAVQPRRHDLASLTRGTLHPDSNYCFGEGGAGTFSDGKLYTRSKDKRAVRSVLHTLVAHGAPPEILVESRPHIGSNRLPKILLEMRAALEARGVAYLFEESMAALLLDGACVQGVRCRSGREVAGDAVLLAVGHSARPVYEALAAAQVALEAKPFAVGARVEHPQPLIDRLQYGKAAGHPRLPAAFYHLTAQVATAGAGERGVYSFCMCPGGWVVDASTEPDGLCVNGMSLSRRDSPLANSALVVTVEPRDFVGRYGHGVLDGIELQRQIERHAFVLGGGGFVAPAQRLDDFRRKRATEVPLKSTYRPGLRGANVRDALPDFVGEALEGAFATWQRRMPGFVDGQAQLVGVETRTSSPVRILRDDGLASPSHPLLFPAGEGAGYAGGIVSAAIDGLRVADAILARL